MSLVQQELVLDNRALPPSPEYMPARNPLQIPSRARAKRPTLEQERFAFLLKEIEEARASQRTLESLFLNFRRDHTDKLAPLRERLRAACRESVFALDRLLDQRGWSGPERDVLEDMLRATAEALLETDSRDEQIKGIYDKHNPISYDSQKQQELDLLKEHAEEMGFDLGDPGDIRSEDDLMQRMYEELAAREDADELRQAAKKRARKSAAQSRKEDSAKLAKQALRELYRKLASIVHPDRERDPARHEEKNLLMQKINQAYAANDLMALFEAQMQLEQIDANHIARLSAERLKQYNKLLSEQLTSLKNTLRELQAQFRADFGLAPTFDITANKLNRLIRTQARNMRAEITRQQHLLDLLADKAATKRWLKAQRRLASGRWDLDDEDLA